MYKTHSGYESDRTMSKRLISDMALHVLEAVEKSPNFLASQVQFDSRSQAREAMINTAFKHPFVIRDSRSNEMVHHQHTVDALVQDNSQAHTLHRHQ